MTDALIVNPPTLADLHRIGLGGELSYFEFERQTAGADGFRSFPGEHLGMLALAAACRRAGIDAAPINGQVAYHRSLDETWHLMQRAAPSGPAIVGFSGPCQVLEENLELARRVRRHWPQARIVFGHDFATLNYARLLEEYDCIDAVALGEGERSFVELCRAAMAGGSLGNVNGVAVRGEAGRVEIIPAPLEPLNLDELPWVARDHLPAVIAAGMSAGVFSTRGCPYRCSFCTTGQTAGLLHKRFGYRYRSIEDVVDEIHSLEVDFDIPHLTIVDDLFVTRHEASRDRARAFAHALRRRGVRVPFMIDSRVDSIDEPTFTALRDAGLHRVFVGVETGNAEQLAFYRKRYGQGEQDIAFVRKQMRILEDLGIEVVPGIITFHPEIRPQELLGTLGAIDACGYRGTFQFMNRVFVHPGTSLWHDYRRRGLLVEEWPMPTWEFVSDRARDLERSVLNAITEDAEFDEVRSVFEAGVRAWLDEPAESALATS